MEYAGLLLIVLILFAIAGLYFAIARLLKNRPAYPAEIEAFGREHNRLVEDLQTERQAAAGLRTDNGRLVGRADSLERDLGSATQAQRKLEHALADKTEQLSQASARLLHSERANAEIRQFLTEAETKLSAAFADLASRAFDERSKSLERSLASTTAQSRSDIEQLLLPYAARLGEFRQRLDTVYGEEARERTSLLGAVNDLKTLNQDVADKTAALTSVLRGSAQVRGDWGGLILERVLSSSGLAEGQHYRRGAATSAEDAVAPVIVELPDDRQIVIDCGFDLADWREAMNASDAQLQQAALSRHAAALRQHVVALGGRNIPRALGGTVLEISVAFIPIEGALSAALGADAALQTDAFAHKVALASPNTLIALLAVVARLWVRDELQHEAAAVSAAGGKVLEALVPFLQVFDKTCKQLSLANDSVIEARRLLNESSQTLIPHAQRLAELGVLSAAALTDQSQPES